MTLLELIAVLLIVAWGFGYGGHWNLGGNTNVIHLLLVVALVIIVIRLIQRRNPNQPIL